MKRNVFGALFVAGGLALWTSVASLASDTTPTAAPDAAIAACAATFTPTDPSTFTGEAKDAVTELNVETSAALSEIVSEANDAIAELTADADQEDANTTVALTVRVQRIETAACNAIANLKAEYAAAIAELTAESNVEKQDANQTEVDQAEKPEVRSTEREGND